jgi:hypothetical protein
MTFDAGLPTATTPPLDVLKILILQRRDAVLEAIESYYKVQDAGSSPPSFYVTSRVRSLFFELESVLRRYYKEDKNTFVKLGDMVLSNKVGDAIAAFRKMNEILDEKQLIRWDTQKRIDTTRVENENLEKGL